MRSVSEHEDHFRRRMRAARTHIGMTQANVADVAGLDRQVVARIETDPTRRIRLGEAIAIVAALRGDLGNFLSDDPIRLVTEVPLNRS